MRVICECTRRFEPTISFNSVNTIQQCDRTLRLFSASNVCHFCYADLVHKIYFRSLAGNVKRPRPSDGDELVVEGGGHALSPSGEPVLATVAAAKSASSSREVPATRIRVRQGSVADISPSSATVDSTIAGAGTAATAVAAAATAPAGSAASAPALASAAVAGMGNIESTRSKSATGAAAVAVKAEDCDAAPLAKRRLEECPLRSSDVICDLVNSFPAAICLLIACSYVSKAHQWNESEGADCRPIKRSRS